MTSYPQSGTDYPRTEFLLDGTWTDVSGYVRGPSGTGGITITRGRADAQSRVSNQTSTFTLENTDYRFSNRYPTGAYYGLLRNAQVRHSAGVTTNLAHLWMPYDDQGGFDEARTADKAVLDITGDLEIRADIWPHTWRPDSKGSGGSAMILATKYEFTSGNQRSWYLYLFTDGTLIFTWSSAGTSASNILAQSTAAVPATTGRLSVKVTLDVDNGAAGNDVKFYTATSIDGSYTQLGSTVTHGSTTSVFASTADLCIGTGNTDATIFGTQGLAYGGRFYEFRLYSGIAGTLVANPKFYSQTPGTTSFSDGLGTPNTWAVGGSARITSDRYRFYGELTSLPQSWDNTRRDVYVQAQASGLLKRLTTPGAPLRSAIYRQMIQYSSLTGYWPMEDASNADSIGSAVTAALAAQAGGVTFGASTSGTAPLPGSASAAQFNSTTSQIVASVPSASSTGTLTFVVYFKLSALPLTTKTLMIFYMTGTARRVEISLDATNWHIDFYDSAGTNLSSTTTAIATISPSGEWVGFNLLLETSGGNVSWSARWVHPGEGFLGIGPTTYAGTVGRATQVRLTARDSSAYADALFAHLFTANADIGFVTAAIQDATNAYNGETAADRVSRLCAEEGVNVEITGLWDQSMPMGYQAPSVLADLLYECADTDLGMLGEARDRLALTYRTRGDIEARRDVSLVYTDHVLSAPPLPTDDDRDIANDLTVSRSDGSSYRYVVDSGPLSTATPPDGVGSYPRSWTANPSTDARLKDVAGRLIGLGTWDEVRIPNLAVALHRSAITDGGTVHAAIIALDCGDTVALTGLPAPMPPDDLLLLTQGYTETLGRYLWDIVLNTTPAKPLQTGIYNVSGVPGQARYDTSGSTLNTTINTSATTIILDSTDTDDTWTTTSASYPFDIVIEGERITLTAAPGATSPQTFTSCTRSVNGVSKGHTAGAAVSLAEPFFYG